MVGPDLAIVLVPDVHLRGHFALFKQMTAGIGGTFSFEGVAPGKE
jgi:hypothetical protein